MTIFRKAQSYANDQIKSSLSSARDRARTELNLAKNRLKGFTSEGTRGRFFGKSESLYYPLENITDNPTGDRTAFWLQIEAKEQKGVGKLKEIAQSTDQSLEVFQKISNSSEGITAKTIWLYLPSMAQNDSVNVDAGLNIGVSGAVAASAIQRGGGIGSVGAAAGQQIDQLTSAVSDIRLGKTPSIGAIATAIGFAKDIPIVNRGANVISYATGITKNPHTISLFQGVNLRTHTFEFSFVPRNEAEAKQVEEIIRFFRVAMYPISLTVDDAFSGDDTVTIETTDANGISSSQPVESLSGDVSLAFIHPNTFSLSAHRMTKEGQLESLAPQGLFYKESILTSCSVNFDPGQSLAQRPDGSFPASSMTLEFVEVETLDRNMLKSLYSGQR